MIRFVNAKINLGLYIIRKREDGYHELETLFYPVGRYNGTPENPEPFCDILEIHLRGNSREDEFSFSGNSINCEPGKNLVVKAVRAFNSLLHEKGIGTKGVCLTLDKHIPDGAGLGGGSADASFTLTTLNMLYGTPLSNKELLGLAATLGADCPFFIENRPVTAKGIGEEMHSSPLSLDGHWCVVVKPDVFVSTKEAFAGITPKERDVKIGDIVSWPIAEWEARGLENDFENHIFLLHPELACIKTCLKQRGALYAAMSGSGSSLFGIFPDRASAENSYRAFPGSFLIKL